MQHEFKDILYEIQDGVATISINRPEKMNSVTADTLRELEVAFDSASKDSQVGVVVFTGVGDRAFCAGADVSWQREGKMGHTGPRSFAPPHHMFNNCSKPIIARVNGVAMGGGNHFAYFCDFTIAADHAVFGQSEGRVAYPASGPAVSYLTRIVGHKRAREMWMLARKYNAQQMLDWGLVNAVVPSADLDTEVRKWADELLAIAPTCLKVFKATFVQEFQELVGAGDSLRRLIVPDNYRQTEQKEGTEAFLAKRRPDYSRFR